MAAHAVPPKRPGALRLLLTGDVMLGRGIDQILPHHVSPQLHESWVKDAREYVALAEEANGPLPPGPRGAGYPWGIALQDMEAMAPDVRVINLETALTTSSDHWPGKGIHYRCHPGNVAALAAAGVDVAVLANNHSLDWGRGGLEETLATVQGAGIQAAGAGRSLQEAQRPAVVRASSSSGRRGAAPAAAPAGAAAAERLSSGGQQDGRSSDEAAAGAPRVLVWAMAHESSGVPDGWAAEPAASGVWQTRLSAADVAAVAAAVAAEKRAGVDVAVVSIHWGSNWGYQLLQGHRYFAHALIDEAGVDVVHGHSSHHARGFEVYKGRLILYGCGDLISDYEGIRNPSIHAVYPRATHRDDVGLLWYADVAPGGELLGLTMTPTRLRHLRLEEPEQAEWDYITATLDREARRLGLRGGVAREGRRLVARLLGGGSGGGSA